MENLLGEVAEWSNALDLKSSVAVMLPWVQIPPSPYFEFEILGQNFVMKFFPRESKKL